MNEFQGMSDEYLRHNYVPNVYQPSIYAIDYQKLKDAGIKFISFDIDDTIADLLITDPPKEAVTLFENLKSMGFELMLLTNTWDSRARNFAEKLGIKGRCIPRAQKPLTTHFQTMKDRCGLEKTQMAHVGNSMRDDIAGGNAFGITTCLVRRAGVTGGLGKRIPGVRVKGQVLRKELLDRGIWRKHHKEVRGDQYYQLGELPKYQRTSAHESQKNIAEATAADLITKIHDDKDKIYTLEELQRNSYKDNEIKGMKTLRTHLGDDIVFTSVWADARDERELEESELTEGELSGFVFTIGRYTIRSTVCLYRDDDTTDYLQRVPAGPDEISEYQKDYRNRLSGGEGSGFREVQVISARYKGAASDDWMFVCLAATSVRWSESIDFICTVRYAASDPDEKEMLFVLNQYTGDSYGVAHWYKLSSDGVVTEYEEHPYNPESDEESWKR